MPRGVPAGPKDPVKRAAWIKRRKKRVLENYAKFRSVGEACEASGITHGTIYHWKKSDPEFSRAWDDMILETEGARAQACLDEVSRRAIAGVEEPVFYKGVQIATIKKYSDTLLIFLTKKYHPEFRENSTVNLAGKVDTGGGLNLAKLSTDELRLFLDLAEKANPGEGGSDGAGD